MNEEEEEGEIISAPCHITDQNHLTPKDPMDHMVHDQSINPCVSSCTICHRELAKYTCPRCMVRTCSLTCIKEHKLQTSCSGKRDRATYIPLNNYSENDFIRDQHLLEEGRLWINKGTSIDSFHLAPLHPDPLHSTVHSIRQRRQQILRTIASTIKAGQDPKWYVGLELDFLPESFERARQNQTRVERISSTNSLSAALEAPNSLATNNRHMQPSVPRWAFRIWWTVEMRILANSTLVNRSDCGANQSSLSVASPSSTALLIHNVLATQSLIDVWKQGQAKATPAHKLRRRESNVVIESEEKAEHWTFYLEPRGSQLSPTNANAATTANTTTDTTTATSARDTVVVNGLREVSGFDSLGQILHHVRIIEFPIFYIDKERTAIV